MAEEPKSPQPPQCRDTYVPFPTDAVAHRILPEIKEDQRIIIIGDPHGCLDELKLLLEECKFDKTKDQVIIVGDLVNKGPQSVELIRYVREQGFHSIKGNHDDYALQAYASGSPPQDISWVNQLTDAEIRFLLYLPFTISIPQFDTITVHAGLVPGIPLKDQHLGTMYRMRNLVQMKNEEGELKWHASERDGVGAPWATVWPGPEHVIFGHDAMRKLQEHKFATGLDTGCVYGLQLTAFVLPDKKLVSVQALKEYSKPTGI